MKDEKVHLEKGGSAASLLKEGRNCWLRAHADRASVLIDTAAYFAAFAEACTKARYQIIILGWDFDRQERLFRDSIDRGYPDRLGQFLVSLVRRNRKLNIYLLSWDFNMLYAVERELLPALRLRMQAPPRFHFRLDGNHPKGASHHQKIVVVDDRVAFVGGIDLSRWRWDTSEHLADDPRRRDPNGKPYPPFHDMMLLVAGPVAARLGVLARDRWRRARGWRIKKVPPGGPLPWPEQVRPQLRGIEVAIARTDPEGPGRPAVHEVRQLYLDAIAAAKKLIYIENQYLTAECLAEAMAARLAEPVGPEIVLILPCKTGGWLEQVTMDVLRARVLHMLVTADRHDRLRVYYPYQPGLGHACISVHAKLLIVDDRLVRIGSSNTSSRSMGLDTECDLAIESLEPGDAVARFAGELRLRLLSEHLDCSEEAILQAERAHKGTIGAIESLRGGGRSLRPLDYRVAEELDAMVPDSVLVDPPEPFSPEYFISQYIPREDRRAGYRRIGAFVFAILILLGLAGLWKLTPMQQYLAPERFGGQLAQLVGDPWTRSLAAIGGVVVASSLMVPLTLLAIASGIVFEGWLAFAAVYLGAIISAIVMFTLGRIFGKGLGERLNGSPMHAFSQRLANRGTFAVAILRVVPVAPFMLFNLLAGASHLKFTHFLMGSILGLAPGLAAITLFSASLRQAIMDPSIAHFLVVLAWAGGLIVFGLRGKRWLGSG